MFRFLAIAAVIVPAQAFAFSFNQNSIECSGTQGSLVEKCILPSTQIAPAQTTDSDFFISYSMTCDQGTDGPERSSLVASLPNGKEISLNSNQPSLSNVYIGSGVGPLVLKDNSPDELMNGRFNDCQLLISVVRVELSAAELARRSAETAAVREKHATLLQSTKQEIELHRQMLVSLQSSLYFRSGQRNEMACLIKTWSNDEIFVEMVVDLKTKYESVFGEFKEAEFDCTAKKFPQLSNEGMTCSDYTVEGVQKALRNMAISLNSRYFYESCSTEKSYSQLLSWYEEQSKTLGAAILQIKAAELPDLTNELEGLHKEVSSILERTCTPEKCAVVPVEASTVSK